jgi:replicative DNA helicase
MNTKNIANDMRLPPNDNDAEEAVLGSLLIDGQAINQIADSLQPSDFYFEQNRIFYTAAIDLFKRGESINNVTIAQELNRIDKLDAIGGAARLSYLVSVPATSMDIEHFAGIVRRLSISRQLITAGDQISAIGYEALPDASEALSKAEKVLMAVDKAGDVSGILSPQQRAQEAMEHYSKLHTSENPLAIPTGFYDIDKLLGGGFYPGELEILSADTGHGKSTLAYKIAHNVAKRIGAVLYLSSEMRAQELTNREVSTLTGKPPNVIRYGKYDNDTFASIMEAVGIISETNLWVTRPKLFEANRLRMIAYRLASQVDLKLIVVDNINDIIIDKRNKAIYKELGDEVMALKNMGEELDVPVLGICQLNKELGYRPNKRPTMNDIYESKRISQIASNVMLLYRIDKYWTREDWDRDWANVKKRDENGWSGYRYEDTGFYPAGIAEVLIPKMREDDGENKLKVRKIVWDAEHHTYTNLARE